jgi:bacterioferritin
MQGNPSVIATLQVALKSATQLHVQYRADRSVLQFMGIKRVAKHIGKFGDDTHEWMAEFKKRLLLLGGTIDTVIGPIVQRNTIGDIFTAELAAEMAFKDPSEDAVQVAVNARDDTTRNLFEHLLKDSEERIGWLEQQIRLLTSIGEPEYISAKITR